MKKTLLFLLFSILFFYLNAQDVIYTIEGKIDTQRTSIDSILIENISNNTRILFSSLPNQTDYNINLTQKALWGKTITPPDEQNPGFKITSNYPGFLCLTYNHNIPTVTSLYIYNMQGQEVYKNKNHILTKGNLIRIYLGPLRFYVVKIQSSYGIQGFKVVGSNRNKNTKVSISQQAFPFQTTFEKPNVMDDDFSYNLGDSIRVSVYKQGYYAFPKSFKITGYNSLKFRFSVSHENSTGISNAYRNLSNVSATTTVTHYNTANGNVQIKFHGEVPNIHPGEIVTVDMDTAGYLRKVVNIVKKDSTLTLTTTAAQLEDVFVNRDLKLDTRLITPKTTLKKTSSYNEIIKALTDRNGYIHPVKIIYHDNMGRLKSESVFKNSEDDAVRVSILDFYRDLKTNLYGKDGDNVHFYIEEGHISLVSDAVFEINFKDNGATSRRTKAKIGSLSSFSFYLDSKADFLIKLALDLNKEFQKENTKKLINIPKATAEFIVPPGIPVWITFNCGIYGSYYFSSDASLHADWGFESNHTLKVGGTYDRATGNFTPIKEYTPKNTIYPLNISGEINDSARLELYPRVDIKLYGVLGPFAEIVPYVTGSYHAKFQSQFFENQAKKFLAWNSAIDLGLDLRAGISFSIFKYNHDIVGPINIPCFDKRLWDSPTNIELMSTISNSINVGDNADLQYKITDLWGNPVLGCPVYVDGNGSFDRQLALTGPNGEASFMWTAGNPGNSKITATIFQAEKEIIQQKTTTIFVNNPPPPVAGFNAVPKSGAAPLTVNFIDQSSNNPTQWQWDFGDGAKSTEKSPTHKYTTAGKYTVSLIASNNYGKDTETKSDYIIVGNLPVANFTVDKTTGKAPLIVNFTDHSTGNPSSWSWEFGDGGVSAQRNPLHKYQNAGNYTVRLTVSNQYGTGTPKTKDNYVVVKKSGSKPTANFTANPVSGSVPLRVQFINNSSGSPTSYHWDFGDGVTSSQQSPVHTYQKTGKYTVALTATNEFGQDTKTETDYIDVNNTVSKLTANFSASPISGTAPLTVYFTDKSTGNPTSYHWDFGDGTTSDQKTTSHTYEKSGTFLVKLTVSNEFESDTKTEYISVRTSGASLSVNFKANPTSGTVPLTVQFTDLSTGNPTSWIWDFGDGDTSNQQNPIHVYQNIGTYSVKLTIANSSGGSSLVATDYISVTNTGTFTDPRDGQTYKTVKIGDQIWFAENLNYKADNSWWYDNNSAYGTIYGRLYTWDAAQTACPSGWHLPRNNEWNTLIDVLGGKNSAGGKMKEKGTSHWSFPNTGATNSSGFTARPGGIGNQGKFDQIGETGFWWTSTSGNYPAQASSVQLTSDNKNVSSGGTSLKLLGFSVRCVKN